MITQRGEVLPTEHMTVPIYSQTQALLKEMYLAAVIVILIEKRVHTDTQRWKWVYTHLYSCRYSYTWVYRHK